MKKKYFLSIALVFVLSLIYSRYMVSVCMIGFTALAIHEAYTSAHFSFRSFFSSKAYSGLILVFVAILLSGINSTDTQQWLLQIKLKLPFIILPFAFFVLRPVEKEVHWGIHIAFIVTCLLSTIHVFGMFFSDYEAITNSIGKGKSIPTPIDHIHYSIMIAYAVTTSAIYAIQAKKKIVKIVLLMASLYLFAYMHFLSVRTGLVLSYAGVALVLLWYVVSQKKYLFGLATAIILCVIPFIAFNTVETFKRKINYMFWDFAQFKKGKGKSYSDSERLMSYAISMDLIKERPYFGHGIGDLRPIMVKKHKEMYGSKDKYIYPHNQYLYILACLGGLGAFVFFFALLSPIIFTRERNIFLIALFMLMLLSFLVENTIQRAVITAFFLFFILLNLGLERKQD